MIDEEKMKAYVARCIEHCKKIAPYDPFKGSEGEFEAMCLAAMKVGVGVFLDSLWHDASERPRDSSVILVSKSPDTINLQGHTLNVLYHIPTNWDKYRIYHKIEKYLYVDDILPKEGGEK